MKKGIIIYSSATGNTKRVAEAMQAAMPDFFDLADVQETPVLDNYEVVAFGYWVNRSAPNQGCIPFMKQIKNKYVILFQTLGAEPMGEHAMTCIANGGVALGEQCKVIGAFSCQGEISKGAIEAMKRMGPQGPHSASAENLARWASAEGHPDESDLGKAQAFIRKMCMFYEKFYQGKPLA